MFVLTQVGWSRSEISNPRSCNLVDIFLYWLTKLHRMENRLVHRSNKTIQWINRCSRFVAGSCGFVMKEKGGPFRIPECDTVGRIINKKNRSWCRPNCLWKCFDERMFTFHFVSFDTTTFIASIYCYLINHQSDQLHRM